MQCLNKHFQLVSRIESNKNQKMHSSINKNAASSRIKLKNLDLINKDFTGI